MMRRSSALVSCCRQLSLHHSTFRELTTAFSCSQLLLTRHGAMHPRPLGTSLSRRTISPSTMILSGGRRSSLLSFSTVPQPNERNSSSLQTTDDSATTSPVVYKPVDFEVSAKIEGEESHIITIELQPGECVRAESGSMIFMTESIQMNTTLAGASNAFKRMMTGQNVFLTDFSVDSDNKPGTLCLGTDFPSKILRLNLQDMANETLICQRGAYLASNPSVNIDMEFTKSLSAGFFGGQGFVLQKLTGRGDVLVKGGGTIVIKHLNPGERLRVSSGSIVAFENTIDYDITMMPGVKNAMFGGEGLFVTTLTGPGRVWLQGMPPDRMIAEIASRVPAGSGLGFGIPLPIGGGGGGGGEAADAPDGGVGAAADGSTMTEQVAATDAAIEADRQATVASSGLSLSSEDDAGSPSALFGDAAPPELDAASSASTDDSASFASSSTEPSFTEDDSFSATTSDEPTFDDTSFSSEDEYSQQGNEFSDGELFDDTASDAASAASEAASGEQGSSIFQTLWDLFMGGDDD